MAITISADTNDFAIEKLATKLLSVYLSQYFSYKMVSRRIIKNVTDGDCSNTPSSVALSPSKPFTFKFPGAFNLLE